MAQRRTSLLLIVLAAVASAATLSWASRAWSMHKARALFAAAPEVVDAPLGDYYPACVYRVGNAGGQSTGKLDAVTGATVARRLRSPSVYRERAPSPLLHITYPPDRALFPPNLCAPFVTWADEANDLWQVVVEIPAQGLRWDAVVKSRRWRIAPAAWRAIREHAMDTDARIQVLGVRAGLGGRVQASRPVHIRVSRDPADGYVVYRLVPPPFARQSTPDTFTRDIGTLRAKPFLLGRQRYCFNCHMFSSKDGGRGMLSIQVRYMIHGPEPLKVYLGIYDLARHRGRKVKLPFKIQMTTYNAWSPDGTKLAISANQQVAATAPLVYETQNVTQPTSDIAIYDVAANTAYMLPGACDPNLLELFPRWSLDGQFVVFAAARRPASGEREKYDLRAVRFNNGQGGPPRDIPGASHNGKSNYFPRFSPDGKWLSFCQCNAGSLIKSSSDIWLAPAALDGPAHRLESNAPYAADSWHSWSSNGRWLVFASKRDDGIYARLYFTHIDADGHASPAVRLPLMRPPLMSFNIPEFLSSPPRLSERELYNTIRVERPALAVRKGGAP